MGKNSANFEATIIRAGTQEPFPKFTSVESYKTGVHKETKKREYIIVQKDDEFEIKLQAQDSVKVYGVKLYIDGQYIHYKKTFLNKGYIRGYKLGHGLFRAFKFQVPDVAETDFQKKEPGEKPSTIRVEFYETRIRYVPKITDKKRVDKDTYQPPKQFDDKKRYIRTLTVKNGGLKQFKVDLNRVSSYLYDPDKQMYKEFMIDEENLLDAVEFGYSDFFTLQIKGLLTLSNVEHLQFIPREHIKLENRNLLRSIVETLIASNSEGITFEELAKLFGKKVMVTWKEVSNGPIQSFVELELSKRVTYVDGKVCVNKEESKGENMRRELLGRRLESGIIPKYYYEVPKDRKLSSRSHLLRQHFARQFSHQTPLIQSTKSQIDFELAAKMQGKQIIVIDDDIELTPEETTRPMTPKLNERMEFETVPRFSPEEKKKQADALLEDPFSYDDEDVQNPGEEPLSRSMESNFMEEEYC